MCGVSGWGAGRPLVAEGISRGVASPPPAWLPNQEAGAAVGGPESHRNVGTRLGPGALPWPHSGRPPGLHRSRPDPPGWEGTRVGGGSQALLRPHPPPGTSGPHLRDFAPAALTPSPECGRLLPATQEWAPGSPLPGGDWPAVACAFLATALTSPWFLSPPATWARPRPGQQPRGLGPVPRGPGGAVPRRPVPAGQCPRPPGTPGPLCLQPPGL